MFKDFTALLDNMQDAIHRVPIYTDTWVFIRYQSHNNIYISDEQLHAIKHSICHVTQVHIEGFEAEHRSEICSPTTSQSWRGGNKGKDWV